MNGEHQDPNKKVISLKLTLNAEGRTDGWHKNWQYLFKKISSWKALGYLLIQKKKLIKPDSLQASSLGVVQEIHADSWPEKLENQPFRHIAFIKITKLKKKKHKYNKSRELCKWTNKCKKDMLKISSKQQLLVIHVVLRYKPNYLHCWWPVRCKPEKNTEKLNQLNPSWQICVLTWGSENIKQW